MIYTVSDDSMRGNYLERPLLSLALHVGQGLVDATGEPVEQASLLNNRCRLADNGAGRVG